LGSGALEYCWIFGTVFGCLDCWNMFVIWIFLRFCEYFGMSCFVFLSFGFVCSHFGGFWNLFCGVVGIYVGIGLDSDLWKLFALVDVWNDFGPLELFGTHLPFFQMSGKFWDCLLVGIIWTRFSFVDYGNIFVFCCIVRYFFMFGFWDCWNLL